MKKLIQAAFVYTLAALGAGAFYREFTKLLNFEGSTSLAFVHTHLMALGSIFFLILALFAASTDLVEKPKYLRTVRLYNASVILMIAMMFARGILDVVAVELPRAVSASVSGLAGLTHIFLLISFILLFNLLRSLKPKIGEA